MRQTRPPHAAPQHEVLLYSKRGTRFGMGERWWLAGSFPDRLDALHEFRALCREFRPELTVVLVVAAVEDPATGQYRNRVVDARGRAPLIDRDAMSPLTPRDRGRLAKATLPEREMRRHDLPAAGGARLGWSLGLVALASALAAWAALVAFG
jgi:hypothetical protein